MTQPPSSRAPRTTALQVVAGIRLDGARVIVTGAAGDLGLETVRALASAGAEVVAAVRDVVRAEAALRDVPGRVQVDQLDLGDLKSVRAFAARQGGRPLQLLINNAGVMNVPYAVSAQGVETHLAVNHLGHFLLTVLLTPALAQGAPSRVVTLSSSAHRAAPLDFDDLNFHRRPYDAHLAYAQSKTANALFTLELDRFAEPRGIRAFAVMPGVIETGLMRTTTPEEIAALKVRLSHAVKTAPEGAATSVWAAVAPELAGRGGLYLEDCAIAEPGDPLRPGRGVYPHAQDPEAAARLWRWSQSVAGPSRTDLV